MSLVSYTKTLKFWNDPADPGYCMYVLTFSFLTVKGIWDFKGQQKVWGVEFINSKVLCSSKYSFYVVAIASNYPQCSKSFSWKHNRTFGCSMAGKKCFHSKFNDMFKNNFETVKIIFVLFKIYSKRFKINFNLYLKSIIKWLKTCFKVIFEDEKSGFNFNPFKMTPKHILSCLMRIAMKISTKMLSDVH